MDQIFGRSNEIAELRRAMKSQRSELITINGRRRVGKTFLVRKFFDDKYTFHYVGAHRQSKAAQLNNFREALEEFGAKTAEKIDDWHTAFVCLKKYLETCNDERKVIFFDEMPWADTQGGDFLAEFEYFWANWVQNRDDIVFIACGSATSWMKDKLEDNQGGLHNRITHRIYLQPFTLGECKEYLDAHGFDWDYYTILQSYMVFGGVPYYLSLLRNDLSLIQNIDNLIFRHNGDLKNEFNELFNALFNKADRYVNIVRLLATRREGFVRNEIENASGYSGGGLSKMLDNLERCDFITAYAQFGNKNKLTLYRLSDFFTLFYFRYVEGNRTRDDEYWLHHFTDRGVASWEGFTFEEVCLRHLPQIKQRLGISGMATEASAWRYVPKKGEPTKGAQIDLVIKRADKIIHLVEMKFSENRFNITKNYEQQLIERRQLFAEQTGIGRGLVFTFITPNGLSSGSHSQIVHSQLTAEDLFG